MTFPELLALLVRHEETLCVLAVPVLSEILPFTKGPTNGILHGLVELLKARRAPKADAPKSGPIGLVALALASLLVLDGCACFRPAAPEYNSKKCVITRQAIECTKDSVVGLLPLLPMIAVALMSNEPIDWQEIANRAQEKGLANAACILAALRTDLSSPESKFLAERADVELERLAAIHYGGAVNVHLPGQAELKVRAAR